MIKQVIPNFFNIFAEYREIVDLKIDEQRNVLYALSY